MAFDPFKYGTYFESHREPSDGEAVSHFNYIKTLPTDLQKIVNNIGSVGYYYSIPSIAFSKWMDYVFKRLQNESNEIQKYEPHFGSGIIKNEINYIYTAKVARAGKISYISCFMHQFFERGSVIIISADDISTVWWKDYMKKLVETALNYWASGMK